VENKDLIVTAEFEASVKDVFKFITTDVGRWWGQNDFHGKSERPDDEFTIHHPGAHWSRQRLIEVIPDQRVVWLVTESRLDWLTNKSEWTGTKMIFELSTRDDNTLLRFVHEGLIPEKECYDKCAQGWNRVIKEWLPDFITRNERQ